MTIATLGAGCFWCIEAILLNVPGIISIDVGYSGGATDNPTYQSICTGTTGHAEVAQIEFNEEILTYEQLLTIFWKIHDPTTLNRQGNDIGTQYRSAIFTHSSKQKTLADESLKVFNLQLKENGFSDITTDITQGNDFFYAEDYHQQYLSKNPNGYCGLGGTGISYP